MDKEKIIKEIIGEAVQEYGFDQFVHDVDGYIELYDFERKDGDLKQYIIMTVSIDEIRLQFMTNAYGQFAVEASNLIPSDFDVNTLGFIKFGNEEEFKKILYHFRDIILQKGFAILEEISKPTTEARPRKETYWKVFTENKELDEKYRKMYGLENTEFTRKMMQKISDIILSTKDQEFKEVEEMLVGLAAVYGNQIIRKCGGEWKWKHIAESCVVDKVFGDHHRANPLSQIIFYWDRKKEDINYLLGPFKKYPYDTVI